MFSLVSQSEHNYCKLLLISIYFYIKIFIVKVVLQCIFPYIVMFYSFFRFFLASFYTKYDFTHFILNFSFLVLVLLPKLPQFHMVRLFGINKYWNEKSFTCILHWQKQLFCHCFQLTLHKATFRLLWTIFFQYLV